MAQYVSDLFFVNHNSAMNTSWEINTLKLYKSLTLMEINNTLYKIICYVGHQGPYAFTNENRESKTILKLKAMHRSCRVDIFFMNNSKGTIYMMKYMPCFKTCDQCLRIAQRAARRWRDKRRSERALPVAMALHKRLGAESTIHCVQEDIMRLVCAYL